MHIVKDEEMQEVDNRETPNPLFVEGLFKYHRSNLSKVAIISSRVIDRLSKGEGFSHTVP
jgi:hypothetical protein